MSRTILLVEDDSGIAAMLQLALGRWGYRVLHAPGAAAALDVSKKFRREIGVVFCDVVLPDSPGPATVQAIRRHCPAARIVFTSGYPFDVLTERGLISMDLLRETDALYLPKPFLPQDVRALAAAAFRELETESAQASLSFSFGKTEAYVAIAH